MRSLSAILSFRLPAIWFKKGKSAFPIYPIILAIPILLSSYESFSEERVQYLKKVGEIKEGFSSEKENFFVKITGLCCDDEGNLYVADSGWNKIFKFDPNGKFIMSFGREGQGPGEFLAHPMRAHLKISFGNDGKLYVNDPGNGRLSIFSKEGKFVKSFKLPPFTYDAPVVNSKGDIYLLSKSGIKVIDCYDSNFKYKFSFLDIRAILKSTKQKIDFRNLIEWEVLKSIDQKDNIVILSNYAFKVLVVDTQNNIKEFEIEESLFNDNLKKSLEVQKNRGKLSRERRYRGNVEIQKLQNHFIVVFKSIFFDFEGKICILYGQMVLRYKIDGLFLETWKFPEKIDPTGPFCSDNSGNIYSSLEKHSKIGVYSMLASGNKRQLKK